MVCDNCSSKNHSTGDCSLCFDYKNNKRCKKCTGCINSKNYYDKINKDSTNYIEIYEKYDELKNFTKSFFLKDDVFEGIDPIDTLNNHNNKIFKFTVYFLCYIFFREEIEYWLLVKTHRETEENNNNNYYVKNIVYEKLKVVVDKMIEMKNNFYAESNNTEDTEGIRFTFEIFCDILGCFSSTKGDNKFINLDIKENSLKRHSLECLQSTLTEKLQEEFAYLKENMRMAVSASKEIQFFYETVMKDCYSYKDISF